MVEQELLLSVVVYFFISGNRKLKNNYNLQKPIIKNFIGAVSTGIVENKALLDLDYKKTPKLK